MRLSKSEASLLETSNDCCRLSCSVDVCETLLTVSASFAVSIRVLATVVAVTVSVVPDARLLLALVLGLEDSDLEVCLFLPEVWRSCVRVVDLEDALLVTLLVRVLSCDLALPELETLVCCLVCLLGFFLFCLSTFSVRSATTPEAKVGNNKPIVTSEKNSASR